MQTVGSTMGAYRPSASSGCGTTLTNGNGEFSLQLPPGWWRFRTSHPAYAPRVDEFLIPSEHLFITLAPPTFLRGTVLDPSGSPAAYANIALRGENGEQRDTTDAEGRFSFAVDPGRHSLAAWTEDYVGSLSGLVVRQVGDDTDGLIVRLGLGHQVSGRVEQASGRPCAQGRILVEDANGFRRMLGLEGGRFSAAFPTGEHWFDVICDGHAPPPTRVITISERIDDLVWSLDPGCSIAGEVVDQSGRAVAGATVLFLSPGVSRGRTDDSWPSARTDAQGRFSVDGLGCGVIEIVPTGGEIVFALDGKELKLDSGTTLSDVVVQATLGATISGKFFSTKGVLLPGRSIELRHEDGETSNTVTTPLGRFALHGLRPGTYSVWHDGHELSTAVVLHAREHRSLNLTYAGPTSNYGGMVLDEHGTPLPHVGVSLLEHGREAESAYHARTDPDGRFSFESVPEGSYWLRAVDGIDGRTSSTLAEASASTDNLLRMPISTGEVP